MTSFLILSISQLSLDEEVRKLAEKLQIDLLDRTIFDLANIETKTPKKSWGIDDVKQLQKKLLLKPIKSKAKAIILHEANLLTHEAQNAFLKVLEEPPPHTVIILTADSKESFLPTVLSRCQLVQVDEEVSLAYQDKNEALSDITRLLTAPLGDQLKRAETLSKNKEDAVKWITSATVAIRSTIHSGNMDTTYVLFLNELQKTNKVIKTTNANLRLTLEQLFLASRRLENTV